MKYDIRDWAIVNNILSSIWFHGKKYCYPSQETQLEVLSRVYNEKMCRRTLNYRLKKLSIRRVLFRIRRHIKSDTGSLVLKSTAYYVGARISSFIRYFNRLVYKTNMVRAVQGIAQYYKKSKDLLIKIEPKCGQVVNNLSFDSS